MPANTYPDGFPLDPLAAINFSDFLSDSEKEEWKQWLNGSTPEQKNELVDILHSMWIDNQKNAVPKSVANTNQGQMVNPQQAPQAQNTTPPAPIATSNPFTNVNLDAQNQPTQNQPSQFTFNEPVQQAPQAQQTYQEPIPNPTPSPAPVQSRPAKTQTSNEDSFTFNNPKQNTNPFIAQTAKVEEDKPTSKKEAVTMEKLVSKNKYEQNPI